MSYPMMRAAHHYLRAPLLLLAVGASIETAVADDVVELRPIAIDATADAADRLDRYTALPDQAAAIAGPDTASLIAKVPGAALTDNGPLSDQIQYRGLFGPRNNVLVDGMKINNVGPNWMDPPLHYLSRPETARLQVIRGIAPVDAGIETLGVTVLASSHQIGFGDGPDYRMHARAELDAGSVNDGISAGGFLGLANNRQRFDLMAAHDRGDDADFGGGTISDSAYRRSRVGADWGMTIGGGRLDAQIRYGDTAATGTPALPMDIEYVRTGSAGLQFQRPFGDGSVLARLYYSDGRHAMNNYGERPTPDFNMMMEGPDQRRIKATASNWGLDLIRSRRLGEGQLETGLDIYLARNEGSVFNPQMAAFRVDSFDHIHRDLYSAFAQWDGPLAATWQAQLGGRYTRVEMEAGAGGVSAALPAGAQNLAAAFAAADRCRSDDNFDFMAQLGRKLSNSLDLQLSAARKTRSPSYFERYAYIPLETTGGLGDGNTYVGDVGLDPEVAWQSDIGLAFERGGFSITPHLFYSRIDDYIQGTPVDPDASMHDTVVVGVSSMNGDVTPLRFSNVDAELYGADLDWRWAFTPHWIASGVLGYTRGRRRDIDDDLYRIAPLKGIARLQYRLQAWEAVAETVFAAEQTHSSAANADARTADPETAGYGLLNLYGGYRFGASGTQVQLGVGNVFDRTYYDALSGYNRVSGGELDVGQHLPGRGRNVFVRLTQTF